MMDCQSKMNFSMPTNSSASSICVQQLMLIAASSAAWALLQCLSAEGPLSALKNNFCPLCNQQQLPSKSSQSFRICCQDFAASFPSTPALQCPRWQFSPERHIMGKFWLCLEIVHTFKTMMCFTAPTSLQQQHLLQAVWGPREPSEVEENHLLSAKRCRIYWWWHFGLTGINSPLQILITCGLCFSVSPSTKCVFTRMQRAPELLLFCWVSFSLVPFSFHALVYKFLISFLPE